MQLENKRQKTSGDHNKAKNKSRIVGCGRDPGRRMVLVMFQEIFSHITEIKQISYSVIEGYLDVIVLYESKDPEVRLKIYEAASKILSIAHDDKVEVDFHSINLLDYDLDQRPSLIPSYSNILLAR